VQEKGPELAVGGGPNVQFIFVRDQIRWQLAAEHAVAVATSTDPNVTLINCAEVRGGARDRFRARANEMVPGTPHATSARTEGPNTERERGRSPGIRPSASVLLAAAAGATRRISAFTRQTLNARAHKICSLGTPTMKQNSLSFYRKENTTRYSILSSVQ